MYGSDYLLGLSTFAPDAFAERDRALGGGRSPASTSSTTCCSTSASSRSARRCPAYRHDAAMFLELRGWASDATARRRARPGVPTATAASSPTSPSGSTRSCEPTTSSQVKRLAYDRRAARTARRRSASTILGVDDEVDPDGAARGAVRVHRRARRRRSRSPNRFAVLPMEGWDGTTDGRPTDLVRRRWRRFGDERRRAGLGREATAVRPDGRANPNQLVIDRRRRPSATSPSSRRARRSARREQVVGLQLTHSGRWSRPDGAARRAPRTATRPRRARPAGADGRARPTTSSTSSSSATSTPPCSPRDAGFDFVDVKHCHGYLLHELLGAVRPTRRVRRRPSSGRTAFLRRVVDGIRDRVPGLAIAVRLSAFDFVPFVARRRRRRRPGLERADATATRSAATAPGSASTSPRRTASSTCAATLGIGLVCITAGQPVLQPAHPAAGVLPAVGRLPAAGGPAGRRRAADRRDRRARRAHPGIAIVGSGYSYLQEWLPHVGAGRGRARRRDDRSGSAAWHARVPGAARRRARRPAAADVAAVPHVQRLHHGAAQRPGVRLLPARPFYKERPERIELAAMKKATRHRVRR